MFFPVERFTLCRNLTDTFIFGLDPGMHKHRSSRAQTVFAIHLAAAFDNADAALMPPVYGALEADFQLGPGHLGHLAFCQSLAGALSMPVWGHFADRGCRVRLLALACLSWGVITLLTGLSSTFWQLSVLRVLNGAALSVVNPVASSLLADLYKAKERGRTFGVNASCKVVGGLLGAFAAGKSLDATGSWRYAFYGYSVLAVCGSVCVYLLATEPSFRDETVGGGSQDRTDTLVAVRTVCRSGTFLLITLHGIFGAIPYHAFGFLTLWFQSGGTASAGTAALLASSLQLGLMVGSLLGGWLGDDAARFSPRYGRVSLAQLADLIRLPLVYVIFHSSSHSPTLAAGLLFCVGLVSPWVSVGANRPILSEIVPSNMRARVFSYQLTVEAVAAGVFGAQLVGWLAENIYNYKRPLPGARWRAEDHKALGAALFDCVMVPWIVCASIFSLVHLTYPRERQRVLTALREVESA